MIYENKPEDFSPKLKVVSCFVRKDDKFLMLLRQGHKPEGNKWGVPAGKIDKGESSVDTIVREVFEETGLEIKKFGYFKKLFVRYPDMDFIYHMFYADLEKDCEIKLRSEEHKDYKWVTPEEALDLPLILDNDLCIKLFYGIKNEI